MGGRSIVLIAPVDGHSALKSHRSSSSPAESACQMNCIQNGANAYRSSCYAQPLADWVVVYLPSPNTSADPRGYQKPFAVRQPRLPSPADSRNGRMVVHRRASWERPNLPVRFSLADRGGSADRRIVDAVSAAHAARVRTGTRRSPRLLRRTPSPTRVGGPAALAVACRHFPRCDQLVARAVRAAP
jgi:hypothetical protein